MPLNVQVEQNDNESSANIVRRFTKRVQNSGIVKRMRGARYHKRVKSDNVRRMARLKKIRKRETYEEAMRMGKITDKTHGKTQGKGK